MSPVTVRSAARISGIVPQFLVEDSDSYILSFSEQNA
jgi:hypothetical protein